jgi:hypothetical protein
MPGTGGDRLPVQTPKQTHCSYNLLSVTRKEERRGCQGIYYELSSSDGSWRRGIDAPDVFNDQEFGGMIDSLTPIRVEQFGDLHAAS